MKLISLNISIIIDNAKQVGEFITSQKPDIVAFQEIIRHFDESVFDMYKSKSVIEKIIGKELPYSFFWPLFIAKDFKHNGVISRDMGGYIEQGNEVITRFPIIEATNNFYYKAYSYDSDRTNFKTEDHSRALQVVKLNTHGNELQILNVHGTYSKDKKDSERSIAQCKYILTMAKKENIPTIIVGDFNLFQDTQSIQILDKEFRNLINEYNISTTRPDSKDNLDIGNNVVDYIFVSDKIQVNTFQAYKTDISDHYPLILDFDILD